MSLVKMKKIDENYAKQVDYKGICLQRVKSKRKYDNYDEKKRLEMCSRSRK